MIADEMPEGGVVVIDARKKPAVAADPSSETQVPVWGSAGTLPALGKPAGVKKRVPILLACHDSRLLILRPIVNWGSPNSNLTDNLVSHRGLGSNSGHTVMITVAGIQARVLEY
jgi:hypothetical protein